MSENSMEDPPEASNEDLEPEGGEQDVSEDVLNVSDELSLLTSDSDSESVSNKDPLIPDNVEDELQGSVKFIDNFTSRFGEDSSTFWAGTLADAVSQALLKPVAERQLLALYLHQEGSIFSNLFCTEVLCCKKVKEILLGNFVVWGWDVSCKSNKNMFLESSTKHLGRNAGTAMNMLKDRLPQLVVVSRVKACIEIRRVLRADTSLERFITDLQECIAEFTNLLEVEAKEEKARASRERLKSQQDAAYKESLEIDRARTETKRRKLEEQAEKEQRDRQLLEDRRRDQEEERQRLAARLNDEPSGEGGTMTLRFKPDNGQPFQRRFLHSSTLREVIDYLIVKGYRPEDYRMVTGWPRIDLASISTAQLIKDLPLDRTQETVILVKRSASVSIMLGTSVRMFAPAVVIMLTPPLLVNISF